MVSEYAKGYAKGSIDSWQAIATALENVLGQGVEERVFTADEVRGILQGIGQTANSTAAAIEAMREQAS